MTKKNLNRRQLAAMAMKKTGAYDYSRARMNIKSNSQHNVAIRQIAPNMFIDMTASPMNRAHSYSFLPFIIPRKKTTNDGATI